MLPFLAPTISNELHSNSGASGALSSAAYTMNTTIILNEETFVITYIHH